MRLSRSHLICKTKMATVTSHLEACSARADGLGLPKIEPPSCGAGPCSHLFSSDEAHEKEIRMEGAHEDHQVLLLRESSAPPDGLVEACSDEGRARVIDCGAGPHDVQADDGDYLAHHPPCTFEDGRWMRSYVAKLDSCSAAYHRALKLLVDIPSVFQEFVRVNDLSPRGSCAVHLFVKFFECRGVVPSDRLTYMREVIPFSCLFHVPELRLFHVSLSRSHNFSSVVPSHMQSCRYGIAFKAPVSTPTISDCADLISSEYGLKMVLDSGLFPISHYILYTDGVAAYLAPVYVDFGSVIRRCKDRTGVDVPVTVDLTLRYRAATQSLWARHKDWILFSPAGLTELLLILSGDVELNPGPGDGKTSSHQGKSGQKKQHYSKGPTRAVKQKAAIASSAIAGIQQAQGRADAYEQFAREAGIIPPRSSSMPPLEREDDQPTVSPQSLKDQAKPISIPVDWSKLNEQPFSKGQFFTSEIRFLYTSQGWVIEECSEWSKWPTVEIVETYPDGSIEVIPEHFPINRFRHLLITKDELLSALKAKIFVSPDTNLKNICFALNRVPDRSASIEHNFLVQMVLLVMSTPHSGYVYFPDSVVTVSTYECPPVCDVNGKPVTREDLEKEHFRFDGNYEKNVHYQNTVTHTGNCGFNVEINIPAWGSESNIVAMIAKRFGVHTLNPISSEFLREFDNSALALSYFIGNNLPELKSRSDCFTSFLDGRTSNLVQQGWEYYGQFEEDFATAVKDYSQSGIDFFPKCEIYSEQKPPRGIACRDFKWRCWQAYCMGPTLYAIEKALSGSNVKGLRPEEIRSKLESKFEDVVKAFETDFSSFEANLRPIIRRRGENVVFGNTARLIGEYDNVKDILTDNAKEFCKISCDKLGWHNNRFPTIRFSGDYWTSIGNQVENILITFTIVKMILRDKHMDLDLSEYLDGSLFEGDDGAIKTHNITKEEFDNRAARYGFKLKVVEGDWTSLSFCGNNLQELPDGTLVRTRNQKTIAAQLSVIFTSLPRNAASYNAYLSLQRSKALSFLQSHEAWIPDTTVLGWMIEGRTRCCYGDDSRRKVFISAYGRISEFMPFALEKCLTDSTVPSFKRLTSLIPGSDAWIDELFLCNAEVGGTFTRSDLYRMWSQLNDPERGCFADVPGLSNDSTLELSSSRKYEITTKCSRDREYARMLEKVTAERSRFLAREAFHCSNNITRALENQKVTEKLVRWRYLWWLELMVQSFVVLGCLAFGVWFYWITAPTKIDDGFCYAQPKNAWYGTCPVDVCYSPEKTPWYGLCYDDTPDVMLPAVITQPRPDPEAFRTIEPEPNFNYRSYYGDDYSEVPVRPDHWYDNHLIDRFIDLFVQGLMLSLIVLVVMVVHECFKPRIHYQDPDLDDDE